jgi:hypothetical protein
MQHLFSRLPLYISKGQRQSGTIPWNEIMAFCLGHGLLNTSICGSDHPSGPMAWSNSKLFTEPAPHQQKLPAYEHKLIGLVKVVRNWRPYLWGRAFLVPTDHYSLKFLLGQHLSTIPQHTWVNKLFGYDISVEYRPGKLFFSKNAGELRLILLSKKK